MSFLAELYLETRSDATLVRSRQCSRLPELAPSGVRPWVSWVCSRESKEQLPRQPRILRASGSTGCLALPVGGHRGQSLGCFGHQVFLTHREAGRSRPGVPCARTHLPPITSMVNLRASWTVSGWPCRNESELAQAGNGYRCPSGRSQPCVPQPQPERAQSQQQPRQPSLLVPHKGTEMPCRQPQILRVPVSHADPATGLSSVSQARQH